MFTFSINQWAGQTLEELASAVLMSGVAPRDVGVFLYSPIGLSAPPISGEVLVAIVALKKAGFLL